MSHAKLSRAYARACALPGAKGRAEIVAASAAAAAALLLLLVVAAGLVDLVVTHGDLRIARTEAATPPSWAGNPDETSASTLSYRSRGLLPLAWQLRNSAIGGILRGLYASVPLLQSNDAALLTLCALAIVVGVLLFLSLMWLDRCAKRHALEVVTGIRRDIYRRTLSLGAVQSFAAGLSPEKVFADSAERLRFALAQRWKTLPAAPVALAVLAVTAMMASFWWSLSALLATALLWYFAAGEAARWRRQRRLLGDRTDYQMIALTESLKHVPTIIGYQLRETPGAPFEETIARHERMTREWRSSGSAGRLLTQAAVVAVVASLAAIAARSVLLGHTTAFQTGLAALCVLAMYFPLRQLAAQQALNPRREHAAEEIFRFLDRQSNVEQAADAVQLPHLARVVELHEVSLHDISGQRILDKVSLTIPRGRRLAVLSTDVFAAHALPGLLVRFFDPSDGSVLFDGQDIRGITLASLRRQSALVLQEGLLFAASVRDNIACGDARYTDDDVIRAAKLAAAYDFVQRLPQGFETVVGQHGLWLDPSECLRIGLARAALRDPALLIVEEPWEDLAPAQAPDVERAMAAVGENRAVVTLATRLATLRSADEVVLFHQGKLHAQGPHDELVQHSDLYRHVVYMRFNEYGNSASPLAAAQQAG